MPPLWVGGNEYFRDFTATAAIPASLRRHFHTALEKTASHELWWVRGV